jgi:predicted DNA-binding ribbon-helix-helix protein
MVVAKRSISVPEEIWQEAQEIAAEQNTTISALIAAELENMITVRRGLKAVREYERERGAPFTAEELAAADAEIEAAWRSVE